MTLMECILHCKVDSPNIPLIFKTQKMSLVETLKEESCKYRNLPSIRVMIMLFLVFPDNRMDADDDSEVEAHNSNADVCASNTLSTRSHHIVNMSNRTLIDSTNLVRLDIYMEIRIYVGIQRCFVGLKEGMKFRVS